MNRIRGGAAASGGLALLARWHGGVARAQETTGRVIGRVTDKDTASPLGGVTVIAAGSPGRGRDAHRRQGRLPVHAASRRHLRRSGSTSPTPSTQVEQPASWSSPRRRSASTPRSRRAAQAAAQADLRHHRQAARRRHRQRARRRDSTASSRRTSRSARTYGDVIDARPGRLRRRQRQRLDRRRHRPREHLHRQRHQRHRHRVRQSRGGRQSIGGGTNLPIEFLTQIDVNSGGYQAEYGGAHGRRHQQRSQVRQQRVPRQRVRPLGAVLAHRRPDRVVAVGGSLGYVRKPDFDTSIGVEVGGPIIKDRLFFWAGFAPRFKDSHVFRQTYQLQYNGTRHPGPALDANGKPISEGARTGAPASTSRTRRTTTPRPSTVSRAPSTTCRSPRSARPNFNNADALVQRRRVHLQPGVGARRSSPRPTPTSPRTGRRSSSIAAGRSMPCSACTTILLRSLAGRRS